MGLKNSSRAFEALVLRDETHKVDSTSAHVRSVADVAFRADECEDNRYLDDRFDRRRAMVENNDTGGTTLALLATAAVNSMVSGGQPLGDRSGTSAIRCGAHSELHGPA